MIFGRIWAAHHSTSAKKRPGGRPEYHHIINNNAVITMGLFSQHNDGFVLKRM